MDLNKCDISKVPGVGSDTCFQDFSTGSESGEVTVYFRDLENHLIEHIRRASVILGAVAWITNERIIRELSKKEIVFLIVQKSATNQKYLYNALPKIEWKGILGGHLYNIAQIFEDEGGCHAVRCFGNHQSNKKLGFQKMHNKFLIFSDSPYWESLDLYQELWNVYIDPYAVWTGSFNLTRTAPESLENAVYISSSKIANAYYEEWQQIAALSESLDGKSQKMNPEWLV